MSYIPSTCKHVFKLYTPVQQGHPVRFLRAVQFVRRVHARHLDHVLPVPRGYPVRPSSQEFRLARTDRWDRSVQQVLKENGSMDISGQLSGYIALNYYSSLHTFVQRV